MFVRCAFFKGKIVPGKKRAFQKYLHNNLVPLWSSFPNLLELRVIQEIESDGPDNPFPLVMVMQFKSHEDIKEALNTQIRWESKEKSKNLLEIFDSIVIHTILAANQFNPFSKQYLLSHRHQLPYLKSRMTGSSASQY